jgi:hypothetical protein
MRRNREKTTILDQNLEKDLKIIKNKKSIINVLDQILKINQDPQIRTKKNE